jgi:outer membrane protein insertion porin family
LKPSPSRAAALSLLVLLVSAASLAQDPAPPADPTVTSLAYASDGPVNETELARLVTIRVGAPLTRDVTGATIRNLFATGLFADIAVEAEPSPGGVDVVLRLARAFRVFPLKFAGVPLPREELRRIIGFSEGAPYSKQEVAEGAEILKHRLEQEGYLRAQIAPDVRLDRTKFDARVEYRVSAGEAARVAPAFFDGNPAPFTREQLLQKAKLKPGKPYHESKARADATRMTEFLHKSSYLKGSIELIAAQPTDDGRLVPVYRVSVGPKVVFVGRGITDKKLQKEVHAQIEGEVLDEDAILQYVETKRRDLQAKGFYRAKVDYAIDNAPATMTVTVTVDPGARYAVEKIAFTGNASVPEKTLHDLMITRKRGLPLLRPGRLTDEELGGDVSAITGWYQTHGWIGVKVETPKVTEGSRPDRLVVTIPIEEGARALVAERKLEGNEHVGAAVLEKDLVVHSGDPFNPNAVRADVGTLQGYYRDHGWSSASVRGDYELSADRTEVHLVYRIEEGPRTFFGKTIVRGNARTNIHRIRRLVTWKEGQPFSDTELLDTQRNLARAGVFRRVDVRPEPADPGSQSRNVDVELQESRPLSVLYGVGYQYAPDAAENQNDPFAVAGVSYNNLFGNMLSAGLEGQVSISGRFRLQLTVRDPYFLGRDLRYTGLLFATREPIQNVDIDRFALVNEVAKYYGKYLRVALRAQYQRIRPVNPQDLSTIEETNFPRFDQPINEATLGPNFLYDRRDDVIDPHHGYYVTAGLQRAFPVVQAEARYTKSSAQAVYFRSVGTSVVAVSLRTGGIWPYGPSTIQVPIAERFFAGGPSSNRGFATDVQGIQGQTVDYDTHATPHTGTGTGSCATGGFPPFPQAAQYDCDSGPRIIGGNGFLALNAEIRIPIAGNLGGDVFYDASQVWPNFSDIRLRFEGVDGLRQSVGIGLHYMLPIGPVRVGLGMPIRPQTIPFNVIDITKKGSAPLATGSTKERLRFFFSLGYPF